MSDFLVNARMNTLAKNLKRVDLGSDFSLSGLVKVIKEADENLDRLLTVRLENEYLKDKRIEELERKIAILEKENDQLKHKVAHSGGEVVDKEVIIKLREFGYSATIISRLLGVSHTTINKHIKNLGLVEFQKLTKNKTIEHIRENKAELVWMGISEIEIESIAKG